MPSTGDQITNLDTELDALVSPTSAQVYAVTKDYDPDIVAASGVRRAGGGAAAAAVVSCLLSRDANIDIHDAGAHPLLWDALYDNGWDFNTLAAIPDGLGLTFAFDGSSHEITTTEAGVWAFSYFFSLPADANWSGTFNFAAQVVGVTIYGGGVDNHISNPSGSATVALPSSISLTPEVTTITQAGSDPYNLTALFSIVRIG